MKRPILTRTGQAGYVGVKPAEWNRKKLGWSCPWGCVRTDISMHLPESDPPTAIKPVLGRRCGGCGAKVTDFTDYDPFKS